MVVVTYWVVVKDIDVGQGEVAMDDLLPMNNLKDVNKTCPDPNCRGVSN